MWKKGAYIWNDQYVTDQQLSLIRQILDRIWCYNINQQHATLLRKLVSLMLIIWNHIYVSGNPVQRQFS